MFPVHRFLSTWWWRCYAPPKHPRTRNSSQNMLTYLYICLYSCLILPWWIWYFHTWKIKKNCINTYIHNYWIINIMFQIYIQILTIIQTTISGRTACDLGVWAPGYRSRGPGFDSRRYIFLVVVGLERGPLNLVRITEGLLERKSNCSEQDNRD
jgi:hypothetical protein